MLKKSLLALGLLMLAWGTDALSTLLNSLAANKAEGLCAMVLIGGRSLAESSAHLRPAAPVRGALFDALSVQQQAQSITVSNPLGKAFTAQTQRTGCQLGTHLPPAQALRPLQTVSANTSAPNAPSDARFDALFDHPADRTHSLLVWEKGALIYERYALGANASRPEAGWSFGKTLIAVAVGRAVQLGVWQFDERSKQALNMQGKAGFSTENRYFPRFTLADHGQVYGGANNVWHALSSAQKNAEVGYNNGDYLWLLSQLQAKIQPQPLADWLQKEVLQPLGLENFYYTVDAQGQPILTGYTHAPARDWLKLGQLLLHNGQWREQAFLPDGWVDFMATPAPNYPDQAYGAGVWLNGQQFYTAPKHVLVMAGAYDQTLIIDRPAQRLLLRMGHVGDESALAHLNAALAQ